MKRVGLLLLIIGFVGIPAQGQEVERSCSPDGYTVVFVNGVFTDEDAARANEKVLIEKYGELGARDDVTITMTHNPSHLAGLGDGVQVVSQALLDPISSYDLKLMLRDMHEKVQTQKVLLVGHSQGTFYTNEIYQYLIDHGLPAESVTIYNLATPANSVRGGGEYHTSTNDGLVQHVREWTQTVNVNEPLPANITIPVADPTQPEIARGHAFSSEYLVGAPADIIGQINASLDPLSANNEVNAENGCFAPPDETFGDKVTGAAFVVADPVAEGTVMVGEAVVTSGMWASRTLADAMIITGEAVGDGVSKIAQTTNAWWFSEDALDDNLEAATFTLLTPQNPENPANEQPQEEDPENTEEEGSVLGEDTSDSGEEAPPEPAEEATGSDPVVEEDGGENEDQQGQNQPENDPENTENEANQQETLENQDETESTEGDEGVDNSGTAGENTIENQGNSEENDESVNNQDENVENQDESDEAPVDPRWGIRSGGSGRSSSPNPDAVRIFGNTMDELTEEEEAAGTRLVQGTIIGSGNTLLVVWAKRAPAKVVFDEDTTRTYYDYILLGRRIRADGSWIDAEPLTLWDPIPAKKLNEITGIMHNGEFVVLTKMTGRANIDARRFHDPFPEGHEGFPYSINMIRVPASGSADNLEAQEIQGESWRSMLAFTKLHLLTVAPLGDDLLVLYQTKGAFNAGLLIPEEDEPFTSAKIMSTGNGPSARLTGGAEAICLDDYCAIYWTRHKAKPVGLQGGLLDVSSGKNVANWNFIGCNTRNANCPLAIADFYRYLSASNNELLSGLGEEGSDYLLLWTTSGTEVGGYLSSTDVLNRDDFPEGTVDEDDLLDVAEYEDGIYEVAAVQNPETGDIIIVSFETDNHELLIAEIDPDDPGAGTEFTAAEDVSVIFQPNIACTDEGCFVALLGTYQETEGFHLVALSELVSS